MRLTPFGIKALLFYGLLIGAYFCAPYVNLFFMLIGFLSVLWVLALGWTWRNASGIGLEFADVTPVAAGRSAALPVRWRGKGRKRFDLRVALKLKGDREAVGTCPVLKSDLNLAITTPALERGIYPFQTATISSTYPFGLFERRMPANSKGEIVVYPAPLDAEIDGRSAEDLFQELLGTGVAGKGDLQPSSLRDHRDGDSMRAVHWRASARRGKLVVQEWDGGASQGMEVVLDRRCGSTGLETALRELSTLVQLARESKQILAIRSQGLNETFGEGHQDWELALRFMASAASLEESDVAPPPASPEVLRLPRKVARV